MAVVIDTNVPVVANGQHHPAGDDCVWACTEALTLARNDAVLIDDGGRILREYRNNLNAGGQPGVGDAFFKWIWDNQCNAERVRQVEIQPRDGSDTDFMEYPADLDLARLDPADRKFVAVVVASGCGPDLLNATDRDWWELRISLQRNGVNVRFLCPELMAAM